MSFSNSEENWTLFSGSISIQSRHILVFGSCSPLNSTMRNMVNGFRPKCRQACLTCFARIPVRNPTLGNDRFTRQTQTFLLSASELLPGPHHSPAVVHSRRLCSSRTGTKFQERKQTLQTPEPTLTPAIQQQQCQLASV